MKREILALAAGLLLLGGCAQKGMEAGNAGGTEEIIMIEKKIERHIPVSTLKKAIESAAKEDGWLTTPLGDRRVIAEKFFNETKNIAAEIYITGSGYNVEYSSGQNISESEARDLLEDLKEAIDEKIENLPAAE